MKPMEWKLVEQVYGPPIHQMRVGKVRVGGVYWALKSKGEAPAYRYQCCLPGLNKAAANGEKPTVEEAKARLEEIVKVWFEEVA